MEKGKNVHQGHRERTIKKFLEYPDSFHDHELLELLLFYAIPRKDTNGLAHRIINTFGSLDKVLKATPDQLKVVDGVGDGVATIILLLAKLIENYKVKEDKTQSLIAPDKTSNFIRSKLKGKSAESFIFVLLDAKYNVINTLEYTSYDINKVEVYIEEVANALVLHRPKFAIIAHNHPSGIADSSIEDDLSTKKFNLLCAIHGVNLIDHIIYTDGALYSYRWTNRMPEIKKQADVERIMEQLKENHYGNRKD